MKKAADALLIFGSQIFTRASGWWVLNKKFGKWKDDWSWQLSLSLLALIWTYLLPCHLGMYFQIPWEVYLNLQLPNPCLYSLDCFAQLSVSKWWGISHPLLSSLKKFHLLLDLSLIPWVQFDVSLEVLMDRHPLGHCVICGSDLGPSSFNYTVVLLQEE